MQLPLFADAGIRGRMEPNRDLADVMWFRVGGPAQLLFSPADEADLAAFLEVLPRDVPVHVLGLASNTLVRDGGVPGVVIRLSARGFGRVDVAGTRITAGTALPDVRLARAAASRVASLRAVPACASAATTCPSQ